MVWPWVMRARRTLAAALLAALVLSAAGPARAGKPEPLVAGLLSAGGTLLPLAVTAGLWSTGRGPAEDVRFDAGLTALALGAVVGPSLGHLHAGTGGDAWVTFLLRAMTGAATCVGVGLALRADGNLREVGAGMTVVAGIPTGLLALYDVFAASSSARERRITRLAGDPTTSLLDVARCGPIPCPARTP